MTFQKLTIKDCCTIVSGSTPRTENRGFWNGDIQWATPKDLSDRNCQYIAETNSQITQEGFDSCSTSMLPPYSVLFSSRAPIGLVAINTVPMCTNQGFKSLVPDSEKVHYKYLYYWLLKNKEYLQSLGNGATFKELSKSSLERVEIQLPSIPEQNRIAAILDKAEEIKRKREESLKLADEFLKSVFVDMFGDPVTNPMGWETKPIGDCGKVITGNTPSRKMPHYYGNHIEWIKSDNINTPSHFLSQSTEMLSEEGQRVGRIAPKGAVLITCIAGSPSCIGNAAIADHAVTFNQQINAFIPTYEEFGTFFYLMLFSNKKIIQAASTNSMKGMVSKSTFQGIKILFPPRKLIVDLHKIFQKVMGFNTKLNTSYTDSISCVKSLEQTFFSQSQN